MSAESIDPKLNQTEEKWGILWDSDFGFCTYDKGGRNSKLRFITQGTALQLNVKGKDPKTGFGKKVEQHKVPVYWNGIPIINHALNVSIDIINTGPVYHYRNDHFQKLVEGKPLKKIRNHLQSFLKRKKLPDNSHIFNSRY